MESILDVSLPNKRGEGSLCGRERPRLIAGGVKEVRPKVSMGSFWAVPVETYF